MWEPLVRMADGVSFVRGPRRRRQEKGEENNVPDNPHDIKYISEPLGTKALRDEILFPKGKNTAFCPYARRQFVIIRLHNPQER